MDKFNKGIDYKIVTNEKSGTTGCADNTITFNNSVDGTFSKEYITMNVFTFKRFCLKSNTKKADEIHNYYIKLETVYQKSFYKNLK